MSIQDFFDAMSDSAAPGSNGVENSLQISWSKKGKGFGNFWFFFEKDENGNDVLKCDNECENRTFIKEILCNMVDNAELVDEPWRNEDGTRKSNDE
mgnify:CR=1 FL=1